jgi:hypothetical protein
VSLGVALGSDYHLLKQDKSPPTPDQYRDARMQLIAKNMAGGPPAPARPSQKEAK